MMTAAEMREITSSLRAREAEIVGTVRNMRQESEKSLAARQKALDLLDSEDVLELQLREATDDAVREYVSKLSRKNAMVANAKARLEYWKGKMAADEHRPQWLLTLLGSKAIVQSYAHTNRSRWRAKMKSLLTKAIAETEGNEELGEVRILLERMRLDVNAYSGNGFMQDVHKLEHQFILDCQQEEGNELGRVYESYKAACAELKRCQALKIEGLEALEARKQKIREELVDVREERDLCLDSYRANVLAETGHGNPEDTMPWNNPGSILQGGSTVGGMTPNQAAMSMGTRSREFMEACADHPEARRLARTQEQTRRRLQTATAIAVPVAIPISHAFSPIQRRKKRERMQDVVWQTGDLQNMRELLTRQQTRQKVLRDVERLYGLWVPTDAERLRLFNEIAGCGDWNGSVAFYLWLCERNIGHRPEVFKLLFKAFKQDDPRKIDRAWWIMDEMHRGGIPVDVHAYDHVLDACVRSGGWRRAILILKRMTDNDIRPSSHSFGLLLKACAHAVEEGPEIYATLRAVGFPVKFAYAASDLRTRTHGLEEMGRDDIGEIQSVLRAIGSLTMDEISLAIGDTPAAQPSATGIASVATESEEGKSQLDPSAAPSIVAASRVGTELDMSGGEDDLGVDFVDGESPQQQQFQQQHQQQQHWMQDSVSRVASQSTATADASGPAMSPQQEQRSISQSSMSAAKRRNSASVVPGPVWESSSSNSSIIGKSNTAGGTGSRQPAPSTPRTSALSFPSTASSSAAGAAGASPRARALHRARDRHKTATLYNGSLASRSAFARSAARPTWETKVEATLRPRRTGAGACATARRDTSYFALVDDDVSQMDDAQEMGIEVKHWLEVNRRGGGDGWLDDTASAGTSAAGAVGGSVSFSVDTRLTKGTGGTKSKLGFTTTGQVRTHGDASTVATQLTTKMRRNVNDFGYLRDVIAAYDSTSIKRARGQYLSRAVDADTPALRSTTDIPARDAVDRRKRRLEAQRRFARDWDDDFRLHYTPIRFDHEDVWYNRVSRSAAKAVVQEMRRWRKAMAGGPLQRLRAVPVVGKLRAKARVLQSRARKRKAERDLRAPPPEETKLYQRKQAVLAATAAVTAKTKARAELVRKNSLQAQATVLRQWSASREFARRASNPLERDRMRRRLQRRASSQMEEIGQQMVQSQRELRDWATSEETHEKARQAMADAVVTSKKAAKKMKKLATSEKARRKAWRRGKRKVVGHVQRLREAVVKATLQKGGDMLQRASECVHRLATSRDDVGAVGKEGEDTAPSKSNEGHSDGEGDQDSKPPGALRKSKSAKRVSFKLDDNTMDLIAADEGAGDDGGEETADDNDYDQDQDDDDDETEAKSRT